MADKILNVRIQNKYDTEANWKAKDPVLLKGEQAFTSDGTNAGKHKIGDGKLKWSALSYAKADLSKGDVTTALGYTPPTSNTWRGIQNNLTSDSTTDSLSAAQGKALKGLVDGKAASGHTHDDRYYTESEMNTKLSGKSDTGHKHAISDVTNLQSTLDGKASSGHTHNYAGSSSVGGSANSAVKLTTARSIAIGGFSSGSANFDGSGNITIDNWGYGCKKYVTTNSTSAPYFRIAHCEDKSNYSDRSMIFVIDSGYQGGGFGIVKVAFRNNDISKEGQSNCELKWLVRQGFSANQLFVKGNAPAGETQYADLYFKATAMYQAISITVLSMGGRGSKIRVWTFEEGDARANPDIRKYTYTVEGSDAGTANYANSAGVVAWGNVSGKPSTFTPASHTHSYAGSASSGGSATSAVKLDTATAGSATQPVYFTGGKPTACTYTLGKSVPSNAVFTDTVYTHPSYTAKSSGLYKVTVDATGHVSATTAVTKADITALGIPGSDTNTWTALKGATTSAAGTAGYAPAPSAGAANRYLRSDGTWAVPPNTVYTHPITSGNKHIPSGGSSGQILRWSADGTATWGNDNNTTYSTGTTTYSGTTKLYTSTGNNTDGTMTQNAITSALNSKVSPNTSPTFNGINLDSSGAYIYGQENSGNIYFRYKEKPVETDYHYTDIASIASSCIRANNCVSKSGDTMTGELVSTSANAIRLVQGNYGWIIRNDGENVYFMPTPSGGQYGGWMGGVYATINLSTGQWTLPSDIGANGYPVLTSTSNTWRVVREQISGNNFRFDSADGTARYCTGTTSDIRFKKNLADTEITDALSVINSIKLRSFDWKETNEHQKIGFVADEIEKIDSKLAYGGGLTEDGKINSKVVDSFYLQGYIVKALQELSSQISILKEENIQLKSKLNM